MVRNYEPGAAVAGNAGGIERCPKRISVRDGVEQGYQIRSSVTIAIFEHRDLGKYSSDGVLSQECQGEGVLEGKTSTPGIGDEHCGIVCKAWRT